MKFETRAVHAGQRIDPATGSVAPPIYLSTTYARDPESVPIGGYTYIRESNPAQEQLEEALCPLEGGEAALVFASGMAAGIGLLQALPPGSHVLFPDDVYYGFRVAAGEVLPNWGIRSDFVAMGDLAALAAAIRPETRLVWLETPSNPLLNVVDLAAAAALAHGAGALVAVDNTFATPVLQRPIEHGADVVLHSTTKYLGGHSDVQGGALVFARRGRDLRAGRAICATSWGRSPRRSTTGWCCAACAPSPAGWRPRARERSPSPAPWRTCRRSRPSTTPGSPPIPATRSPGARCRASAPCSPSGSRRGGRRPCKAVGRVRLFTRATSLGGVESLIEHRATSEGPGSRTPQELIRVSIGLEHPDDLIADLAQALGGL